MKEAIVVILTIWFSGLFAGMQQISWSLAIILIGIILLAILVQRGNS